MSQNIDLNSIMRAIFTQLSFLIAVLTALDQNADGTSFLTAAGWGIAVGCMIYLVLIIGDFSVHRLLDSSTGSLTSVRFIQEPTEASLIQDMFVTDKPELSDMQTSSESDGIAA